MNTELMEALTILEKEKNISRDTMMDAIENSLISACKNHFGTSDNIKVIMNRETCDYAVYAEKEVVEEVFDPAIEITLEDAEEIDSALQIGDVCNGKNYISWHARKAPCASSLAQALQNKCRRNCCISMPCRQLSETIPALFLPLG